MTVAVVAELGTGAFEIQERELDRLCVVCLNGVAQFPWGFECGCGPSFSLGIVGTAYTGGEVVLLVEALIPAEPCSEPEPEA